MANEISKVKELNNGENRTIVPPADIYETEDQYVIKADMPSVKKEGVDITLDNNKLKIKGSVDESLKKTENLRHMEYTLYDYYREFDVGDDIENDNIKAEIYDGVLTITLPKKEEVKPRKIEININ